MPVVVFKLTRHLTNSSLSDKRFKLVFAAWWLAWATMHYAVLLNFGLSNNAAFVDSVTSNALLAGCCLLISNNMRYYLPRKEKYWYVLAISFGWSLIWLLAVRLLLWAFLKNDTTYLQLLSASSTIRYGLCFLMLGCMATMSLLWYTQQEQKEMDERKTEVEKLSRDAELYKLRQQLQPHFLFNSLNSISALTSREPELARKMIHQLSDFLRGTLKKEDQQSVTLAEELQYLELYLEIEKVRFGHRLSTDIQTDEASQALKLPPMLLQPIVENAIKFGLYDTTDAVTIRIESKAETDGLVVIVQNPFDPETSSPKKGTGFGLSSVQRRLFLLFARNDLLQTKIDKNLFSTILKIPQA
jgi:two-component system, LytTR family, sensor kinase